MSTFFKKSTLIVHDYEDKIVHDCLLSIVKSILSETIGRALMSTKESKYFELLENVTSATTNKLEKRQKVSI